MLKTLKHDVCAAIDALAPEILAVSHEIHAHPELAFEEVRASRLLAETARKRGLDAKLGVFGLETAIAADFGDVAGRRSRCSPSTTRCRASVTRAGTTSSPRPRSARRSGSRRSARVCRVACAGSARPPRSAAAARS